MSDENITPPEEIQKADVAAVPDTKADVQDEPTMVPLHKLTKERRKRQELEAEVEKLRTQAAPPVDDSYESVTKGELRQSTVKIAQAIREEDWSKAHPERYEHVLEKLPEFLKERPHYAAAINDSPNRYREAWELMERFTPPKAAVKPASSARKDAPGQPSSVSKASVLDEAIDFGSMSDKEFNAWRSGKKSAKRAKL